MKKALSVFLVFSILILVFSGCRAAESPSSSKPNESSSAAAGSSEPVESKAPEVPLNESFSIMVDDSSHTLDTFTLFSWLEEKTGTKVDWQVIPYEVATQKKAIMLNSGDYTDVIGGWIFSDVDIQTYSSQGVFIPLDEAFDAYSPNITQLLNMEGIRRTMTLPDGHIYTIPYVYPSAYINGGVFINQNWLDKLGLKMPSTTDELIDVLRAFRDQDPNGNNKKDEIGMSGSDLNFFLGMYAGWWGMPCTKNLFTMVDDKITFAADSEAFKSATKFFKQLYEEGLLDQEYYTNTQGIAAKGNKELIGVAPGFWSGDFASELIPKKEDGTMDVPNSPYRALPVLQGSGFDGKPVWQRSSYGTSVFRTQVVVTDKAKDKLPSIITWFDFLQSEEAAVVTIRGPLGIGVEKVGDMTYKSLNMTQLSKEDQEKYANNNLIPQALPRNTIGIKWLDENGNTNYDEMSQFTSLYEPYLNTTLPKKWFDDSELKRASVLQTDLQKFVMEQMARWVTGQGDVDSEWQSYKDQLKKLGLDEYIQIYSK